MTVKDSYPIPRIDDSLEQLGGAQWFSCLDLNAGYWQVEVDKEDREKTAFTSRRGLFEFKVMPFGLCNSPATFERLMEIVLAGLNWQICLIYLDDIIIHGRTFESMLSNLDSVLGKLQEAGLKLKPRKCQLFKREVEYLGHIISASGIRTDPKKVQAVRDWPTPKDVHDVRAFIGLCSYYRRFIPGFAFIAKPLHHLTAKGQSFVWTQDCDKAFKALKKTLCKAPTLAHPDFTKEFILDTDASDFAIGAVLSQEFDGKEHVIAYASKSLSKAERKYCVTRKELYALVHFIKYFRHYLYGKKFTVRTDHGSLRWLMQYKNPEGQVARWLEILSSFDMKIVHRSGKSHKNADGMSRIGCKQCGMIDETSAVDSTTDTFKPEMVSQVTESQMLDLKTAQEQDKDISKIKVWIVSNQKPERKETEGESYFVKSLVSQWERLKIEEGMLLRRWDVLGTDEVRWQGIIPLSNRRLVLKFSHDIKASGHLGIRKTLSKIRQNYYWPGLQNDVKAYINGCEFCARRKDPLKTKRAPMEITKSGFPMERIAIDILGLLPITERGNRYILVIGDYFTKWTESHAMPNMEASTVATILVEQVISRFGIPNSVHSDQGKQFESRLFSEMCKLLQITKTRTTPYHPKSDGMIERFNKTLVAMLSAFVNQNHTDWDEHLQYVMMAYRSTEHETTGLTPNMCMLGRETTCPLDLMFEMPQAIRKIPSNEWVWKLQEKLESAHTFVRNNIDKGMKRQKRYHDGCLSYETLEVGDKVYVYFAVKKIGCSPKFTQYWRGPYEVIGKLSNYLYKVNCGRRGTLQVIHCDRLRKAKSQMLAGEDIPGKESSKGEKYDIDQNDGTWILEDVPIMNDDQEYEEDFGRGKRTRQKPNWMNDYILSIFRKDMARTKKTGRKNPYKCDACGNSFASKGASRYHMLTEHVGEYGCEICTKTFSKKFYYDQHMNRKHGKDEAVIVKNKKQIKPKVSGQEKSCEAGSSGTMKASAEQITGDPDGTEKCEDNESSTSTSESSDMESNYDSHESDKGGSVENKTDVEESFWNDIEEIELGEEEGMSGIVMPQQEQKFEVPENESEKQLQIVQRERKPKERNDSTFQNQKEMKDSKIMEDKIGVSKQEKSKSQPQQDVKESEIGDKREVRDIYSGRVVNKPMRPAPVLAPIKRKALSEQEGTFQKMMKTQETMTDEFKVENSKER